MLTYKDLLLTGPEAVCILNAGLEIRQCNQLADLLLGYRNRKLMGQHLSSILYDDTLISHLLAMGLGADTRRKTQDGRQGSVISHQGSGEALIPNDYSLVPLECRSGWSQGECTLKTSSDLPLAVKFRAAMVADDGTTKEDRYVLVFREMEETQHSDYDRRLKSLQCLLDAFSKRDMEPEEILLKFARTFDQHAEVMLLPPDFIERRENGENLPYTYDSYLPEKSIEAALEAMSKRNTVIYRDEGLWCFFPVLSPGEVYGVACIKFAVPRLYSEEDKEIFGLAGTVLGIYIGTCTSTGRGLSAQSLLQTIFNSIDRPIVVVDRKGIITLCNSAAQTIYGYTVSEMTDRSYGELVFPVDSSIHYGDLLSQVMHGEPISDQEMTHVRSDQSMANVSVTAYPYMLDNGLIVGVVFVISDLREKRRLWSKMVRWEKLAALGEILSGVANDLNNHLTPLTGYCQMLLHRGNSDPPYPCSDKEIDSMVSTIHEAAERCGNIVHSILDLARDHEMPTEYLHVNDIIMASLDLKHHQLEARNIDVYVKLGENMPAVAADPRDIERLFLRIINYAEQRMLEYRENPPYPLGGRLTVESDIENGKIIARFSDTGACVLEDDIAEILDPFCATGGEDEGIELGLSISYQLLRNIGGDLRIDNQIGKNIFTVELPVLSETARDEVDSSEEPVAWAPETGKRIMLVDDEPAIVDMLSQTIHHMGHVADVAEDGKQAMQKLSKGRYDLIITDLRMPCGFTGDKLHEFIKRKDPELAQRMIFITGDVANPETRKFLESTGNPYLEKPFLLESLREAIERLLSKDA